MKLRELFTADVVNLNLTSDSKDETVKQLVSLLRLDEKGEGDPLQDPQTTGEPRIDGDRPWYCDSPLSLPRGQSAAARLWEEARRGRIQGHRR